MSKALKFAGLLSATAIVLHMAPVTARADPLTSIANTNESPTVAARSLADVPYRVVRIADLNLSHPAGVKALQARINGAARSVCGYADIRDIRTTQAVRECRSGAYADAMAQVDTVVGQLRVAAR